MDKVKRILFLNIPMSICNLRCHYCYIAQRKECYQGVQPEMKYTPEQMRKALSKERIGGPAFINICAAGETLLTKGLPQYIEQLLLEGHYVEVVTNLTVNKVLDEILAFDKELLKHLEFKCSFHYLELKSKGMLETYASNVNRVWEAGASASVEVTPSDELIPYIDEIKKFSIEKFGALPHLTIARNDGDKEITYLTELSQDDYVKVWSQFDSDMWNFKRTIFGVKQTDFCYAGKWSLYIDFSTGIAKQCYRGVPLGDVFKNPEKPLPDFPVCYCKLPHCYNGHAYLTFGTIPEKTEVTFADIRNRVRKCVERDNWLQPEMEAFYRTKLEDSNKLLNSGEKFVQQVRTLPLSVGQFILSQVHILKMKKK